MPSFREVEAALTETTHRLAREVAEPMPVVPDWSDFEWRTARATAAMHGVSALLHDRLCWDGPESWRDFLREQKTQTSNRELRIRELLSTLDHAARRVDLAMVGLKGAALLQENLYATGQRPMGDIDLLVTVADVPRATHLLTTVGYRQILKTSKETTFAPCETSTIRPLGEHVDNPIKIELHSRIREHLPMQEQDITADIMTGKMRPGVNSYPSVVALMKHLLLHAAGNMRANALRLIQLQDIALLAARMRPMDWDELLAGPRAAVDIWWAFPPLSLTNRLYIGSIPPPAVQTLRAACRPLLRYAAERYQLTDVSWSRIRVDALPGIEWSRSLLEAGKFVRSRVWPSREALASLRAGSASLHLHAVTPWYGLSHGKRIARWLVTRTPRVQTWQSVMAAHSVAGEDARP